MIQLSLRTEARGEAYILSRKLTAESDRMSDALTRSLISMEDARKWLSHVIAEELARIRRVDLLARMDPAGTAGEDARADWATATAWKLMAGIASVQRLAWFRRLEAGSGDPTPASCAASGEGDPGVSAIRPEVRPKGEGSSFPPPRPRTKASILRSSPPWRG